MTASSESAAKTPDWQKRYFDSLDKLERERQQFGAMEAVLKRLIGRLGSAAQGQSRPLDEQIKTVQSTLRREPGVDELEKLISALTDTIAKLDSAPRQRSIETAAAPHAAPAVAPPIASAPVPPAPVAPTVVTATVPVVPVVAVVPAPPEPKAESTPVIAVSPSVDASLCRTLSVLLSKLRNDPSLTILADELDSKLSSQLPQDELPEVVTSIASLVTQCIQNIEGSKHEIEALLKHMVDRLDDMSRFVSDQSHEQTQSQASREELNTRLVGEMKAIGESVESADDLAQIRQQVRGRLDSIGRHLEQFREREAARTSELCARTEQMQARVAQLEAQTSKLQVQLSDEQRLSTIDGLTNIANRLAYEKRIEEELHRWRRFKQPTCIAVWDIDRFKDINDKHGHRAGDRVLRAVAGCLASRLRRTDFLARFGGEEFVMILCGTDTQRAEAAIEDLRIRICELRFHTSGTPLPPVTISIGLTALLAGDTAGSAFDRADRALYQAKDAGRNRCVSG
ncbi:MAG TPA: diguanylate cyclase [Steroidobacteraceae bacterium]|nr:diguanylate cyclase [Steroidobacteraceae bacterium]